MSGWKKDGLYLSEMEKKIYQWMWDQRIPVEEYVTFAGRGGVGKGAILTRIAASVIKGSALPDEDPRIVAIRKPGLVLWLGPEDSREHTLVWRMESAGVQEGERKRFLAQVWTGKLDREGLGEMDQMVRGFRKDATEEYGPQELDSRMLVVIDPIESYFAGNSNINADVSNFINKLRSYMAGRNITMIGVKHYSKGGNGKDARDSIMGSQAWVNTPRMTLIAGKVGESEARAIIQKKSNVIPEDALKAIEYTLKEDKTKDRLVEHTEVFEWKGILKGVTEDHLMVTKEAKKVTIDITNSMDLQETLVAILSPRGTPVLRTQIDELLREDGFRDAHQETIRRALVEIGAVNDRKGGAGKTRWWIPLKEGEQNVEVGE
jgi:putative DNA primase/helicase